MENPEYRGKAEMPIPTHSPIWEGANEHQGATRLIEPVVCSELQGNELAEAAEMTARQRETMSYLAGIMDADGCFAIWHHPGRNRGRFAVSVFVQIKQVQREAIDLLVKHFGGNIYLEPPTKLNGRVLYRWRRGGSFAEAVARNLLPFLRLKKRQAEIILAMQEEIRTNRFRQLGPAQDAQYTLGKRHVRRYMISDESLARRASWVAEMRSLNDVKGRRPARIAGY